MLTSSVFRTYRFLVTRFRYCQLCSFCRVGTATRTISDGGSQFSGVHTGFNKRFRDKTPFSETTHCFNHREALCLRDVSSPPSANIPLCVQGVEGVPYLNKFVKDTLGQIARFIKSSPTRFARLQEVQVRPIEGLPRSYCCG